MTVYDVSQTTNVARKKEMCCAPCFSAIPLMIDDVMPRDNVTYPRMKNLKK